MEISICHLQVKVGSIVVYSETDASLLGRRDLCRGMPVPGLGLSPHPALDCNGSRPATLRRAYAKTGSPILLR